MVRGCAVLCTLVFDTRRVLRPGTLGGEKRKNVQAKSWECRALRICSNSERQLPSLAHGTIRSAAFNADWNALRDFWRAKSLVSVSKSSPRLQTPASPSYQTPSATLTQHCEIRENFVDTRALDRKAGFNVVVKERLCYYCLSRLRWLTTDRQLGKFDM